MDLDSLFKLPLAEFTEARNALARQLKQSDRKDEAERVKALPKPSVSAWVLNQLYWNHRKEFDALLAAGALLSQAHAAQLSGKTSDVQKPMAARREAVSALLRRGDEILRDAGHSATPETMRRIATTLEAVSTPSPRAEHPLGRLTEDIAPPGFESLEALVSGAITARPSAAPLKKSPKAKDALKAAEQQLRQAQATSQEAAKRLKEVTAQLQGREKKQQEAEALVAQIRAATEEARRQLRDLSAEAEQARRALQDAEQAVQKARNDL